MVFYKTGAVDEPRGKGGVAHLLEHLMFRGTKKVKDKEFYFHSGSTIGTNTLLLFSVDLDLCFLFLTNINGFSTTKIKELFVEYLLNNCCEFLIKNVV